MCDWGATQQSAIRIVESSPSRRREGQGADAGGKLVEQDVQYHTSRKGRLLRACGEKAKRRMGGVGAGANGRSSCRGGETSKTRDASLRAAGFEKAEAACRVHVLVFMRQSQVASTATATATATIPTPTPTTKTTTTTAMQSLTHPTPALRRYARSIYYIISTIWLCLCVKSTHRYSVLPRRPALLYPALPCPALPPHC